MEQSRKDQSQGSRRDQMTQMKVMRTLTMAHQEVEAIPGLQVEAHQANPE